MQRTNKNLLGVGSLVLAILIFSLQDIAVKWMGGSYPVLEGVKLMTAWKSAELDKIGKAEELQIASLRSDGTLRKPVIIWVVRVGEDLYVRSVNGQTSAWFRGTQTRHEGHIRAGGVDKDVTFVEENDSNINDQIDTAYITKYRRYASIARSMVTPAVREATIKLVPR